MTTTKIIDYIIVRSIWRINQSGYEYDIEKDLMNKVKTYIKNGYVLHGPINYIYNENNCYCSQGLIKYENINPL